MTIERGAPWGRSAPLPPDGLVVGSDAAASDAAAAALAEHMPLPVVGLLAGDLCRTVGGPGSRERLHTDDAVTLPIDVCEVVIDDARRVFVAHVVARRNWWYGRLWAALNAEWLGDWDVAPRAHPGDGLLDVMDVSLSTPDRVRARRRLRSGTHVPHPKIRQHRVASTDVEFDRPMRVWADGRLMGESRAISVRVLGQMDVVV
jgi:YegS C-terminal NAD kinase beta sandwich-like domain